MELIFLWECSNFDCDCLSNSGRGKAIMTWEMRVRVALGAARGLAYLHEDCHPRIIHRDIKSSNILLDDKYEAQVSDVLGQLVAAGVLHFWV